MVPVVPNTKVINKEIIYNDQELNIKDIGSNVKITPILTVGEYELNNCIKTIIETNKEAIFIAIQYSKENETVYFYTDREISLYYWYYKPLSNDREVLEEIKRVFKQPKNKDTNCISLYDVSILLKTKEKEYEKLKKVYISKLNEIFNSYFFSLIDLTIEKEIKITFFKTTYNDSSQELKFYKKDGKLIYKNMTNIPNSFLILEDVLFELYDDFMEYYDFLYQRQKRVGGYKPINLKFRYFISGSGVFLYDSSILDVFNVFSPSYRDGYDCEINNFKKLIGDFDEFFKRIFVKIEDCPKWSQPILFEMRQNQLDEEKRIEDEQQRIEKERKEQETKKQKRLEFRNKIFPFLKNK